MNAILELAGLLEVSEAKLLGAELVAGKPLTLALNSIKEEQKEQVRPLLESCLGDLKPSVLGEMLLAMSTMGQAASSKIELVWSGPMPPGAMGRRTWPVAEDLITRAQEYIYAATFSAGANSPYILELKTAIQRGIKVVCLVDPHHLPEPAQAIRKELRGATLLALVKQPGPFTPTMHSKFLVVDGVHAFLTSANFSVAAADANLETGVWVRNPFIAHQIKEHVDHLREAGDLVVWNG